MSQILIIFTMDSIRIIIFTYIKQFLFDLVTLLLFCTVPIVSFGSDDTSTTKVPIEDAVFSANFDHVDVIVSESPSNITESVLVNDVGKNPVNVAVDTSKWSYSNYAHNKYDYDDAFYIYSSIQAIDTKLININVKDKLQYLENKGSYYNNIESPDKQSRTDCWSTHEGKLSEVFKTFYGLPLIE